MPKNTPNTPSPRTPASPGGAAGPPGTPGCPENPGSPGGGAVTPCANCSITPLAVATMPSNRARTRLGVGESTRLTFSLGAATWTQSPAAGSLSSTSGASVTYTAPDRANTVTITATGGGCTATITLTIVEPSDVHMRRKPGSLGNHQQGQASVGFIAEIFILPADVSFENCSSLEDEAYAVGTGCYQQFLSTHQVGHNPSTIPASIGPPESDTSGSKVNGFDRVATTATRYCAGGWTLTIPWRFQVGSGASKVFRSVDQTVTITATGAATISKAGASNHSELNDATEVDPLF